MAIIALERIYKSYSKQRVLKDLSLEIERGKLTCLLGSSGSGKTTILRLIAGLEVAETGLIKIEGHIVSKNGEVIIPPHKRGLGYIFQDLALWPHLSVFENIAFGLKIRKEKDIKNKVNTLCNSLGILELLNKFPNELSGGQQQLVAIARSLILRPSILLMDEPFSSLDITIKAKMYNLLRELIKKFSITIIYVTHDLNEAFKLSDIMLVLKNGKVKKIKNTQEIDVKRLEELFLAPQG